MVFIVISSPNGSGSDCCLKGWGEREEWTRNVPLPEAFWNCKFKYSQDLRDTAEVDKLSIRHESGIILQRGFIDVTIDRKAVAQICINIEKYLYL